MIMENKELDNTDHAACVICVIFSQVLSTEDSITPICIYYLDICKETTVLAFGNALLLSE